MKKIFLLLILAAMLFSCQKEKNEPVAGDQEVTFSATLITDNLKNTEELPPCELTITPTHAHIVITGPGGPFTFDPQVFMIGTKLYTQAIKLPAGDYQVTTFFLYQDNAPAGYGTGDVIVYATPESGPYVIYLTHTLPYSFTVAAFTKIELDIEVLCFMDLLYQNFGFFWFDITEIIIREACFFGDLCIEDLGLWNAPPYSNGGVMTDEEAFIKVEVYVNSLPNPLTVWDNLSIYGTGYPLCVEYPDVVNATDNITFKLYVWVPSTTPGVFAWQLYGTFTTTDALPIPEAGDDQVIDFAIGTCSPDSDPIYPWLPAPPPPTTGGTVDWVAYNDCVGFSDGYVTEYNDITGASGTGGLLVNYLTGTNISAQVSMDAVNLEDDPGKMPNPGTDAYNEFNGIVNMSESAANNTTGADWSYQATFTGLDPTKEYEFSTTVNRDEAGYAGNGTESRWTRFAIVSADLYTNSTKAAGVTGVIIVSQDVVKLNGGYNTEEGNVIKWTGIRCGADGTFTILSQNVGDEGPGDYERSYGLQGFKLIQITP